MGSQRVGHDRTTFTSHGASGTEPACYTGETRNAGSIPGSGRSAGEGIGYPFEYSDLEISMDCTVHGVAKSQTQLSDFHFYAPSTNSESIGWIMQPLIL